MKSTEKLPDSSLPPKAAILDFLEQCEREKVDDNDCNDGDDDHAYYYESHS